MAKISGLGFTLTVQDSGAVARNIANDVTNLGFTTPRQVQDITGIDKSAVERLQLLADMTFSPTGVFNVAANMSHDVYKTVPSSSVIRAHALGIGGKSLTANLFVNDYSITRAANGALTWSAPASLGDGSVPSWV